LDELRSFRKKHQKARDTPLVVGVLGCMAERLKIKLLESDKKAALLFDCSSFYYTFFEIV
jgi:hypothetical protein